jgi:thiosulfate/3-mercaptopyruvate sulfurtransferase
MRTFNSMLKLMLTATLVFGLAGPAAALFDDKFKQEIEKEAKALKLVREMQRDGYEVVTTVELKQWTDSGKDMIIVYDAL